MTHSQVSKYREIHLIKEPSKIVEVGKKLITSSDYAEVLSGLVLMTGLKCEQLSHESIVEDKTPYSIKLTQRNTQDVTVREIPTLTLADDVLKAVQFIRNNLETNHLNNRSINASFLPRVIKVCEAKFKTLVPLSSKKESRYTYLQRSVYGTIATHWYCPPDVRKIDYLAYIYGQENLLEGKGKMAQENLAINLHYFDYQIGINRQNIEQRVGIKLNEDGVTIIDRFKAEEEHKASSKLLLPIKFPEIDSLNLVELLESDEVSVLFQALMKATNCSPSQLLCSQIFEMIGQDEESHLYVKEGKKKRELPSIINPDLIISAVSKLRKSPTMQEWRKLSPNKIDAQIQAKYSRTQNSSPSY